MTDIQGPLSAVDNARSNVQSVEKDTLITQLDELLERYLHTLNEYEKVRRELSKQLSSVSTQPNQLCLCHLCLTLLKGYMSLAQANFHNSSFRYGQDCYDERMQAILKMYVVSKLHSHLFLLNIACTSNSLL